MTTSIGIFLVWGVGAFNNAFLTFCLRGINRRFQKSKEDATADGKTDGTKHSNGLIHRVLLFSLPVIQLISIIPAYLAQACGFVITAYAALLVPLLLPVIFLAVSALIHRKELKRKSRIQVTTDVEFSPGQWYQLIQELPFAHGDYALDEYWRFVASSPTENPGEIVYYFHTSDGFERSFTVRSNDESHSIFKKRRNHYLDSAHLPANTTNPRDRESVIPQLAGPVLIAQRNNAPTPLHSLHHVFSLSISPDDSIKPFLLEESIGGGHAEQGGAARLGWEDLENWPGNWRRHLALAGGRWAIKYLELGISDQTTNRAVILSALSILKNRLSK